VRFAEGGGGGEERNLVGVAPKTLGGAVAYVDSDARKPEPLADSVDSDAGIGPARGRREREFGVLRGLKPGEGRRRRVSARGGCGRLIGWHCGGVASALWSGG
jgi:hypothetical protein